MSMGILIIFQDPSYYQYFCMHQEEKEEADIQKKKIIFKNPQTGHVFAQIDIPVLVKMAPTEIFDLSTLRNKLRMLYIDVLHRGYHPMKGFEKDARAVFRPIEMEADHYNVTNVSVSEAIGTIWRCLGRQIGHPIKKYPIKSVEKQLFDELMSMSKQCKLDLPSNLNRMYTMHQKKYMRLQLELEQKERLIAKEFNNLNLKYQEDDYHARDMQTTVVRVMNQQILSLEKDIFIGSLIGIRQWQQNIDLVELVMEQSYPSIQMSRENAIKELGEEIFEQKCDKYKQYASRYDLSEQDLRVCHRCLISINDMETYSCCNDENATLQVGFTLLTCPYQYNRMVINENCWQKETRKYMHPYLTYFRSSQKDTVALCNRYFCNKCSGMEIGMENTGHCGYCEGVCDCWRCFGMDMLTKMMAVLIDNNGNLKETTDRFLMKLDPKGTIKNLKKEVKSHQENQAELRQLISCFKDAKILVKKDQVRQYRKIEYFSQRMDLEKLKFEKYKVAKPKIDESKAEKAQRKQKQREMEMRIRETQNKIEKVMKYGREQSENLSKSKDKAGRREDSDKREQQQCSDKREQQQCSDEDIYEESSSS